MNNFKIELTEQDYRNASSLATRKKTLTDMSTIAVTFLIIVIPYLLSQYTIHDILYSELSGILFVIALVVVTTVIWTKGAAILFARKAFKQDTPSQKTYDISWNKDGEITIIEQEGKKNITPENVLKILASETSVLLYVSFTLMIIIPLRCIENKTERDNFMQMLRLHYNKKISRI